MMCQFKSPFFQTSSLLSSKSHFRDWTILTALIWIVIVQGSSLSVSKTHAQRGRRGRTPQSRPTPPQTPLQVPSQTPTQPQDLSQSQDSMVDDLGSLLDPRRSLIVTDSLITQNFTFERTLSQLLNQTEDTTTPTELYQEWWSTQRLLENIQSGEIGCDSEVSSDGQATLNGFPLQCPRPEGRLAQDNPFTSNATGYTPIALVNRFDLADEGSGSCGEYRIVYARNSGQTQRNQRNLIIFEAQLPNPSPECGLEACAPVAAFWANLSQEDDPRTRMEALEQFYYEGLPGFEPVIHVNHFAPHTGQIRTNQFMGRPWVLKEFKLVYDCGTGECNLTFTPVPVAGSPAPQLFNSTNTPRALAFQAQFIDQVPSLAASSIAEITMELSDDFYASENRSEGGDFDLNRAFAQSSNQFRTAVQDAIPPQSGLAPNHILNRATALTCAGCHQLSQTPNKPLGGGLVWPRSLGFVHISEQNRDQERGPDGLRFGISPALIDVFLPLRARHLTQFLNSLSPNLTQTQCVDSTETLVLSANDEATPIRPLPETNDEVLPPLSQDDIMRTVLRTRPIGRMMQVH